MTEKIHCKSRSGSIKASVLWWESTGGSCWLEGKRWNSCHGRAAFHRIGFDMLMFVSYQVRVQKKSRCCKEKPQNLWPNISMRFLSCLHVQHKSEYSWRCFSLEWMVLFPIGVKSLFRYSLRQRSKKRSWHLKNIGQIEYTQQQICRGANTATRPPRLIYHFASWGKWNVPTPVALLDDISCLIEASQKKIEQHCTLWRSKETSSEVFEVGTYNSSILVTCPYCFPHPIVG